MRYCSFETRKIVDCIEEYGVKVKESDYYDIEVTVARFWNTHITKVITSVMSPSSKTSAEEKIEKATELGWAYFSKPIWTMLSGRGSAIRTDDFEIDKNDEWARKVYDIICASFVLADFNMRELAFATLDLPKLISDAQTLSRYIDAAKRGGSRNVYYLHGIAKREHETLKGKLKEIQEARESLDAQGWVPDETIEEIDIVDRKLLEQRWKQRLADIQISNALNNVI